MDQRFKELVDKGDFEAAFQRDEELARREAGISWLVIIALVIACSVFWFMAGVLAVTVARWL